MNISFFLKPKVEVSYLTESCPVQKAIDDMLHSGFTAIPVVDAKGKYAGTITEGDFLRLVLHYPKETLEQLTVGQVELRVHHRSVSIDARMEDSRSGHSAEFCTCSGRTRYLLRYCHPSGCDHLPLQASAD